MTDDQARQEKAEHELELKVSGEAIDDLEPDQEGAEGVAGGSIVTQSGLAALGASLGTSSIASGSAGAGAGKISF